MSESPISVIIPTSPVPLHPSIAVIENCVDSIRRHLPDSEIIICCDGVRKELDHRAGQYSKYLCALFYQCHYVWKNVRYMHHLEHLHQAEMTRRALETVITPLVLFFEHDATLDDKFIDWGAINELLLSEEANTVRFYWHCELHPEAMYLMGERTGPFVKTRQWSSWPHVSRTDFFKKIIAEHFPPGVKKMLETVLYSPVLESPWEAYRTYLYCPEGGDGVRFHHLDARRDPVSTEKDFGDW